MDQRSGELEKISGTTSTTELEIKQDLEKISSDASVDETAEPEQLKEQIEQTRSQMSETISAIEEKLSFANISEQVSEQITSAVETAKGAVYSAALEKAENIMKTVSKGLNEVSENMGEAGEYVIRSAKRNPLPLALIGLGVGMLVVQGTRSSRSKHSGNGKHKRHNGGRHEESTYSQVTGAGSKALSSAQKTVTGAAGTAYEGVTNAANSAYEGVSSVAGLAYEGVSSAASSAYQGVTQFASSTGEQVQQVARKAKTQYETTLEENPLAIGAIALALGAVVGLAIPATEYENEWMGEYKENLVQTVEDSARDALGKVQDVAGELTKNVREQAQGQAG
jgi:phage-related protein